MLVGSGVSCFTLDIEQRTELTGKVFLMVRNAQGLVVCNDMARTDVENLRVPLKSQLRQLGVKRWEFMTISYENGLANIVQGASFEFYNSMWICVGIWIRMCLHT